MLYSPLLLRIKIELTQNVKNYLPSLNKDLIDACYRIRVFEYEYCYNVSVKLIPYNKIELIYKSYKQYLNRTIL